MDTGEFLTNKRVLLSSPGYKLNDSYYSQADSIVEAVETTYSTGRFAYALQSRAFGSSSQINIPNSSLIGEVYLHLELPDIATTSTLKLQRGWAISSIASISFLFGSSNVPQLVYSGQSLFQILMCECETAEKRNEVLSLAGQANYGYVPTTNQPKINNWADLVIPLPFSSMCGLCVKKSFDSNVLSNNIIIQINWNPVTAVYDGIDNAVAINTPPTDFTNAVAYLRQGDFSNKGESLRNALAANPDKSLNYPFIHHQSFTPSYFKGKISTNEPISVQLQSIINADLVALSFGVVKLSNLAAGRNTHYEDITNIKLLFNGMVIVDAPRYMYKLVNMGAGGIGSSSYTITGGNLPAQRNVVLINFSRLKSLTFNNHFSNTFRIPNNTLTLQFNTPEEGADDYACFVTYHYNAICQVENGQANLYFD